MNDVSASVTDDVIEAMSTGESEVSGSTCWSGFGAP
jgi:hypothetical protein